MRYPLWKKLTAVPVLFTFIFSSIVWAAPAEFNLAGPVHASVQDGVLLPSLAQTLDIPATYGDIKERFLAESSRPQTASGMIIHIQDAHANLEAQQNILQIIRHVTAHHGVGLIFVEGAIDRLDADRLRYFKEESWNQEMAGLLAKEGVLGGAELFLLENTASKKGTVAGYGVERADLYVKNLQAYRAVYAEKEFTDKAMERMKSEILTQSSKVFNKELKAFFREWLFYQDVPSELMRHMNVLSQDALKYLSLDLNDARQQADWPQLVRFSKFKTLEAETDAAAALAERDLLADWAAQHGVPEKYTAELRNWKPGQALEGGTFSDLRMFLEAFHDAAAPKGFSFKDYPRLAKAMGASVLRSEIRAEELMEEIKKLSDSILDKLARTPEEGALIARYKDYLLLEKLFSLELVDEEYETLQTRRETVKAALARPEENEKAAADETSHRAYEPRVPSLAQLFDQAMAFYKLAQQREEVIYGNMIRKMRETGKTNAILITGGFHARGLHKIFENQGLSYVEVTPAISEITENKNYSDIMLMKGDPFTRRSYVNTPRMADTGLGTNLPDYALSLQQNHVLPVLGTVVARHVAQGTELGKILKSLGRSHALAGQGLAIADNGLVLLNGKPLQINGRTAVLTAQGLKSEEGRAELRASEFPRSVALNVQYLEERRLLNGAPADEDHVVMPEPQYQPALVGAANPGAPVQSGTTVVGYQHSIYLPGTESFLPGGIATGQSRTYGTAPTGPVSSGASVMPMSSPSGSIASPDGKKSIALEGSSLVVQDLQDASKTIRYDAPFLLKVSGIQSYAFSSDNNWIVIADGQRMVYAFHLNNPNLLNSPQGSVRGFQIPGLDPAFLSGMQRNPEGYNVKILGRSLDHPNIFNAELINGETYQLYLDDHEFRQESGPVVTLARENVPGAQITALPDTYTVRAFNGSTITSRTDHGVTFHYDTTHQSATGIGITFDQPADLSQMGFLKIGIEGVASQIMLTIRTYDAQTGGTIGALYLADVQNIPGKGAVVDLSKLASQGRGVDLRHVGEINFTLGIAHAGGGEIPATGEVTINFAPFSQATLADVNLLSPQQSVLTDIGLIDSGDAPHTTRVPGDKVRVPVKGPAFDFGGFTYGFPLSRAEIERRGNLVFTLEAEGETGNLFMEFQSSDRKVVRVAVALTLADGRKVFSISAQQLASLPDLNYVQVVAESKNSVPLNGAVTIGLRPEGLEIFGPSALTAQDLTDFQFTGQVVSLGNSEDSRTTFNLAAKTVSVHVNTGPAGALNGFAGGGATSLRPQVVGDQVVLAIASTAGTVLDVEFNDFSTGQQRSVKFEVQGVETGLTVYAFPRAAFTRAGIQPENVSNVIAIASVNHAGPQEGDIMMKLAPLSVPAGWTAAASNGNYAFHLESNRLPSGVTEEKLSLMDLRTGAVQILAQAQTPSGGRIGSVYDVSPESFPGFPVVVYETGGPRTDSGHFFTVHVQRIDNAAQYQETYSRVQQAEPVLQSVRFENNIVTLTTRNRFPSGTVTQDLDAFEVGAGSILRSGRPLTTILTAGTGLLVDQDTPIVLQPEHLGSESGRLFQVYVYDASQGQVNMPTKRVLGLGGDSSGAYTLLDGYTTPSGKQIISIGVDGSTANRSVIEEQTTFKVLNLPGAVISVQYNGNLGTYRVRNNDGTEQTVAVNFDTMTIVPTFADVNLLTPQESVLTGIGLIDSGDRPNTTRVPGDKVRVPVRGNTFDFGGFTYVQPLSRAEIDRRGNLVFTLEAEGEIGNVFVEFQSSDRKVVKIPVTIAPADGRKVFTVSAQQLAALPNLNYVQVVAESKGAALNGAVTIGLRPEGLEIFGPSAALATRDVTDFRFTGQTVSLGTSEDSRIVSIDTTGKAVTVHVDTGSAGTLSGFAGGGATALRPQVVGDQVVLALSSTAGTILDIEFNDFTSGLQRSVKFEVQSVGTGLTVYAFPRAAFTRAGIQPENVSNVIAIASVNHPGPQSGDISLRLAPVENPSVIVDREIIIAGNTVTGTNLSTVLAQSGLDQKGVTPASLNFPAGLENAHYYAALIHTSEGDKYFVAYSGQINHYETRTSYTTGYGDHGVPISIPYTYSALVSVNPVGGLYYVRPGHETLRKDVGPLGSIGFNPGAELIVQRQYASNFVADSIRPDGTFAASVREVVVADRTLSNPEFFYATRYQGGAAPYVYDVYRKDGTLVATFTKTMNLGPSSVNAVGVPDVSPDSHYLILGQQSRSLYTGHDTKRLYVLVYDAQTGRQLPGFTIQDVDNQALTIPSDIRFMPGSSRYVRVLYPTGQADFYDVTSGQKVNVRSSVLAPGLINYFPPEGTAFQIDARNGQFHLLELPAIISVNTNVVGTSFVRLVNTAHGELQIYHNSQRSNDSLVVFNARTGYVQVDSAQGFPFVGEGEEAAVAFSPSGNQIAIAGGVNRVYFIPYKEFAQTGTVDLVNLPLNSQTGRTQRAVKITFESETVAIVETKATITTPQGVVTGEMPGDKFKIDLGTHPATVTRISGLPAGYTLAPSNANFAFRTDVLNGYLLRLFLLDVRTGQEQQLATASIESYGDQVFKVHDVSPQGDFAAFGIAGSNARVQKISNAAQGISVPITYGLNTITWTTLPGGDRAVVLASPNPAINKTVNLRTLQVEPTLPAGYRLAASNPNYAFAVKLDATQLNANLYLIDVRNPTNEILVGGGSRVRHSPGKYDISPDGSVVVAAFYEAGPILGQLSQVNFYRRSDLEAGNRTPVKTIGPAAANSIRFEPGFAVVEATVRTASYPNEPATESKTFRVSLSDFLPAVPAGFTVTPSNPAYAFHEVRAGETIQRPGSNVQRIVLLNRLTSEQSELTVVDHPEHVDVSPDGRFAIVSSYIPQGAQTAFIRKQSTIFVRDLNAKTNRNIDLPDAKPVLDARFLPGSSSLIRVVYKNGEAELYDAASGQKVTLRKDVLAPGLVNYFPPNQGKAFQVDTRQGQAELIELPPVIAVRTNVAGTSFVGLVQTAHGELQVYNYDERSNTHVVVFNARTGYVQQDYAQGFGSDSPVVFSPSGNQIVTANSINRVYLIPYREFAQTGRTEVINLPLSTKTGHLQRAVGFTFQSEKIIVASTRATVATPQGIVTGEIPGDTFKIDLNTRPATVTIMRHAPPTPVTPRPQPGPVQGPVQQGPKTPVKAEKPREQKPGVSPLFFLPPNALNAMTAPHVDVNPVVLNALFGNGNPTLPAQALPVPQKQPLSPYGYFGGGGDLIPDQIIEGNTPLGRVRIEYFARETREGLLHTFRITVTDAEGRTTQLQIQIRTPQGTAPFRKLEIRGTKVLGDGEEILDFEKRLKEKAENERRIDELFADHDELSDLGLAVVLSGVYLGGTSPVAPTKKVTRIVPPRKSELRISAPAAVSEDVLTRYFARYPNTLDAVAETAHVAADTIGYAHRVDDIVFRALLDKIVPAVAKVAQIDVASFRSEIDSSIAATQKLLANGTLVLEGAGSVILTTSGALQDRKPLLLAAIPFMVALAKQDKTGTYAQSFKLVGENARALKDAVYAASNNLTPEEKNLVGKIVDFATQPNTSLSDVVGEYIHQEEKSNRSVAVSLKSEEASQLSKVLANILKTIENAQEMKVSGNPQALVKTAEAYVTRALLLLDLASKLKMSAELLKQQPDQIAVLIREYFAQKLPDIHVDVANDGSFDLPLNAVAAQLAIFKAAQRKVDAAA
ncbi:MAG TPA: hypothetical protein VL688_08030 [Verrucomicrobiae bacterium]|nr:hypothetical protein [Verrucomicrobiae bacterium]